MKIHNLRHYGKSLLEMMEDVPPEIIKEISDLSFNLIEKHLNSDELEIFITSLSMAKERLLKKNLTKVSEKGLNSNKFINQQIEWAASFSTAVKIIGKEKALKIFREISEKTYPILFFYMFPKPEDLNEFADPFKAFKDWFLAMMGANKKVGLFDYKIVVNNNDMFQMDCIWCAWHETYKHLGAKDACIPICYADDAFYPDYFQKTGIKYNRTKTLGWGNAICDFRFERSVKDFN